MVRSCFLVVYVCLLILSIGKETFSLNKTIDYEKHNSLIEFNEDSLIPKESYEHAIKLITDSDEYKSLINKRLIFYFMRHDQSFITAGGYSINPGNGVVGTAEEVSPSLSCSGQKWYKIYIRPKDETILEAHQTAIFHEFFEHIYPHDKYGDWNYDHSRKDLIEITKTYRQKARLNE